MFPPREAGDVAAEVVMSRQVAAKQSYLLVEGDEDRRFFEPRVARAACELIVSGGKLSAVGAIQLLDRWSFRGAVAVVDDDFDSMTGHGAASPNLVRVDAHDLECLLLRSPALDNVLAEFGSADKLRALAARGETVRELVLERGLVFGRLRWLAAHHGWTVRFKRLSPYLFVDRETWQIQHTALIAAFRAAGCPLSSDELQAVMAAGDAEVQQGDPWCLCHGHDLVAIVAIGLHNVLGSRHNLSGEQVAGVLRQGLQAADFANTGLYQELRAWETRNPPFTVLAA